MIYALKVLDDKMCACNGGSMKYELNKWYEVKGEIRLCEHGFHLTYQPNNWQGKRVFIAQTRKILAESNDKMACRQIRLLKELTPQMLAEYEKVRQQAWAEYKKVRQPAWAEYEKVRQQAWAEYKKALSAYLKFLLTA